MDTELLSNDGRTLKFALKKAGVGYYQVQGICKRVLDKVKLDKQNEAKAIIFEAYITAGIPVPDEVVNLKDLEYYAFLGGFLPGKVEFE